MVTSCLLFPQSKTKMKKLLIVLTALIFNETIQAQIATVDPTLAAQNSQMLVQNSTLISTALSQFKELQQMYQQGKSSYQEFVQIKDFIKSAEDRMKNIGDIKELKLNDVDAILAKVFCIKQGNFFPSAVRFLEIVSKIKAGFLNCDNRGIYDKTFSGLLENFDTRFETAYDIGAVEINSRIAYLNAGMIDADNTQSALNSYNSRMKLELGLKYKAVSDQLMQQSEEIHLAINEDASSDKNIKLSPADRLKLMDMANQYQVQALDYEEKSARLMKEASEMDQQQQKRLMQIKRDLEIQRMINFTL